MNLSSIGFDSFYKKGTFFLFAFLKHPFSAAYPFPPIERAPPRLLNGGPEFTLSPTAPILLKIGNSSLGGPESNGERAPLRHQGVGPFEWRPEVSRSPQGNNSKRADS